MMLSRTGYYILNFLLLSAVVYNGVEITRKIVTADEKIILVQDRAAPVVAGNKNQAVRPLNHYATIQRRDLFDTGKSPDGNQKVVDIAALKPTGLDLKLWGTVANEDTGRAYAVIEDRKTKKQELYRTGDTIQNGAVKMILREKVVLSVDGKDEVLEMASTPATDTPRAPRQANRIPRRTIVLKKDFAVKASRDSANLLSQVKLVPYSEGGEAAGVKVMGLNPGLDFRKLGLRNGDVLKRVAGAKILTENDILGIYERLKSSPEVTLEILRHNRPRTIIYKIQ